MYAVSSYVESYLCMTFDADMHAIPKMLSMLFSSCCADFVYVQNDPVILMSTCSHNNSCQLVPTIINRKMLSLWIPQANMAAIVFTHELGNILNAILFVMLFHLNLIFLHETGPILQIL